jgi:hypothetical protein
MIYRAYYSLADCDECFIVEMDERFSFSPISHYFCDECGKKHEFIVEFEAKDIESLWEWIENYENE